MPQECLLPPGKVVATAIKSLQPSVSPARGCNPESRCYETRSHCNCEKPYQIIGLVHSPIVVRVFRRQRFYRTGLKKQSDKSTFYRQGRCNCNPATSAAWLQKRQKHMIHTQKTDRTVSPCRANASMNSIEKTLNQWKTIKTNRGRPR